MFARYAFPIRVLTSIAIAFIMSALIMRYISFGNRPELNKSKLLSEFADSKELGAKTMAALRQFPGFLTGVRVENAKDVSPAPENLQTGGKAMAFSLLPSPTPEPVPPTIPPQQSSSVITYQEVPTLRPPTKAPTAKPTAVPQPTQIPTPAIPSEYARPGKNLDDIFNIASQKTCVPAALLKAFVAQEGPGALTYSERSALFYNAYDWWHRVTEKKQVCSGYGYFPETGLIAEDSLFAGESCKEGINGDTVSRSLGATQMLEYWWNKTYKEKTQKALGIEKVDRRVLLDSLVAFGLEIKEGTKYSGDCNNWDFKYIIKAACINTGGASQYSYYYAIICRNYNKYANQSNNCDNVASMIVPDSYCQLK